MTTLDRWFSPRRRSPAAGRAAMVAVAVVVLASCAAEPVAPKCIHYDVVSMGPENGFRIRIADDAVPSLEGAADRMDVALTIVPPIHGPVRLVHTEGGKDAVQWDLKVGAGTGVSTRCRLGTTRLLSTCEAPIGELPLSPAGDWHIEAGDNHVLEAGLSFRTCR